MAGLEELLAVFDDLEMRARFDPRLEQYRVKESGPKALDQLPPGWFLSDCITHIAVHGGWWPGHWDLHPSGESWAFVHAIGSQVSDEADPRARWTKAGDVWERDHFDTPLLQRRVPSAPLLGFSSQALWKSMVFPHEAAMMQAFVATYDEMGMETDRGPGAEYVNPFFVEWITSPPNGTSGVGDRGLRVHERLVELSAGWSTGHPCWLPQTMPFTTELSLTDSETIAAIAGVDQCEIE